MRIVINHLTRMERGYICVAGIDTETAKHVRPVLIGRLNTSFLMRNGGSFDMACLVDLGPTTHVGHPPELEDHEFTPRKVSHLESVSSDSFWGLLRRLAKFSLSEIFGPELTRKGASSCGVEVGAGSASLGCLIPSSTPSLYLKRRPDREPQIRARLADGDFDLDLSVTDIRLYRDDHVTPDEDLVSQVDKRLKSGTEVILSVGLTRPFSPSQDLPPIHWLQVNNLHLQDDPTCQLG